MKTIIELSKGSFSDEEYADIVLCLNTLLNVRAGTAPLDKNLGIDTEDIVGLPLLQAQNMFALEIDDKVTKYEPRVSLDSVSFEAGDDGEINAYLTFKGAEEE